MNTKDDIQSRRSETQPANCFVPRGDARLLAIALKQAVLKRGLDAAAITAAVMLAAQVHRHQRRSADGSPFLTHPLQVAALVCSWGGSTDDVVTAVLHDAAEDHLGGPREMLSHIEDLFSPRVSRCVAALTKNTTLQDRSQRMQDLMDRLDEAMASFGPGVAAVRLADRLHNVVTAGHLPGEQLARLQDNSQRFITPLARRLKLSAVVDFLAAGPQAWKLVQPTRFLVTMLQFQGPWLVDARTRRASRLTPMAPA